MLYDNGLLAKLFLDMFQATKQDIYQVTARETFGWLLREMLSDEGAFYASQDADSEGKEGTWYTWELKEVKESTVKVNKIRVSSVNPVRILRRRILEIPSIKAT